MSSLYFAYNGAMATTSPFTPVATSAVSGTAKTMLQVATTSSTAIRIVKWGVMFDGSASTAPLKCELIQTNVAATVTAHVAAGVQPYGPDQSASSVALGTAATGYTANYFQNEWSLAREFFVPVSTFVRIRVTPTEAVARNCTCFMVWEE
jgi:hypothetical protein